MKLDTPSLFIRVAVFAIFAVSLIPLPMLIWMSLFDQAYLVVPPANGYTFSWYLDLPSQRNLFSGFVSSLQIAAITAIISTLIGGMAALGLRNSAVRENTFMQSFLSLPLTIPAIVSSMALYIFLYTVGESIGFRLAGNFWGLICAHTLITLPWTFRLIYAGLLGTERDLERAAQDLGASPMRILWGIVIPLIKSSIISAMILSFIFSFANLEMSLFLTAPGETTLPVAMMQYAEQKVDPTVAAMAVVQLAIVGTLLFIGTKLFGFGKSITGGLKQ